MAPELASIHGWCIYFFCSSPLSPIFVSREYSLLFLIFFFLISLHPIRSAFAIRFCPSSLICKRPAALNNLWPYPGSWNQCLLFLNARTSSTQFTILNSIDKDLFHSPHSNPSQRDNNNTTQSLTSHTQPLFQRRSASSSWILRVQPSSCYIAARLYPPSCSKRRSRLVLCWSYF